METSCSKLRRKIQTKFALEGKKFEPKALQKYFRSKIFHFLFICSWIFFFVQSCFSLKSNQTLSKNNSELRIDIVLQWDFPSKSSLTDKKFDQCFVWFGFRQIIFYHDCWIFGEVSHHCFLLLLSRGRGSKSTFKTFTKI